MMNEKELEELKEQLKKEILADIEKTKYKSDWRQYMDAELEPSIDELFPERSKLKWNFKEAINSIAKTYNQKSTVNSLNAEEIEAVKPLIETILAQFKENKGI